jgi:hypothetical protein
MKENHAPILAVHPAVPLPLVVRLQLGAHRADQVQIVQVLAVPHLHHQDHLVRNQLVQIANVAVKIFRLVVVHPIAEGQLVRYRRGVKPLIHAGFGQSR